MILAPLALCLMLQPLQAQEPAPEPPADMAEGLSLLEEGAKLLLRGLLAEIEPTMEDMGSALAEAEPMLREMLAMMGDLRNYEAPEKLPNGDIILRRKPDAPPPVTIPPEGEIDL